MDIKFGQKPRIFKNMEVLIYFLLLNAILNLIIKFTFLILTEMYYSNNDLFVFCEKNNFYFVYVPIYFANYKKI